MQALNLLDINSLHPFRVCAVGDGYLLYFGNVLIHESKEGIVYARVLDLLLAHISNWSIPMQGRWEYDGTNIGYTIRRGETDYIVRAFWTGPGLFAYDSQTYLIRSGGMRIWELHQDSILHVVYNKRHLLADLSMRQQILDMFDCVHDPAFDQMSNEIRSRYK